MTVKKYLKSINIEPPDTGRKATALLIEAHMKRCYIMQAQGELIDSMNKTLDAVPGFIVRFCSWLNSYGTRKEA